MRANNSPTRLAASIREPGTHLHTRAGVKCVAISLLPQLCAEPGLCGRGNPSSDSSIHGRFQTFPVPEPPQPSQRRGENYLCPVLADQRPDLSQHKSLRIISTAEATEARHGSVSYHGEKRPNKKPKLSLISFVLAFLNPSAASQPLSSPPFLLLSQTVMVYFAWVDFLFLFSPPPLANR